MKSANVFRVLAFGDLIGDPGRWALYHALPKLKTRFEPDLIVVNGENSAQGFGIVRRVAVDLFSRGVDVITGGNHSFQKREIFEFVNEFDNLLRPINYPEGTEGYGSVVMEKNGIKVGVINAMGRIFMDAIECPFRTVEKEVEKMKSEGVKIILVDFHAEATSEKQMMGFHLDGKVSAVWGTHTHILTGDEVILPKKTAYISDIGKCGCINSVLGMEIKQAYRRTVLHMPERFSPAKEGPLEVNGVVIDIDKESGLAKMITVVREEAGIAQPKG